MALGLYRFEALLVPLLDRDLQPILTQSLQILHELLQRPMALGIKLAVLEELTDGHLFATLEHLFEQAEGDLGDEELIVVPIVTVHLTSFSTYLIHAVIIGAVQVLQLLVKLVALQLQLVPDALRVRDLAIIGERLPVQHVKLFFEFVDAGVR